LLFIILLIILFYLLWDFGRKSSGNEIEFGSSSQYASEIGRGFEDYVRVRVFPKKDYILIHRTGDYRADDYDVSLQKPDFEFTSRNSHKNFFIEAKFRSNAFGGMVNWCNESQLKRYLHLNNPKVVFIVLGLGGLPSDPTRLFIFPVRKIPFTDAFLSKLALFEIDQKSLPISDKDLWALLKRN